MLDAFRQLQRDCLLFVAHDLDRGQSGAPASGPCPVRSSHDLENGTSAWLSTRAWSAGRAPRLRKRHLSAVEVITPYNLPACLTPGRLFLRLIAVRSKGGARGRPVRDVHRPLPAESSNSNARIAPSASIRRRRTSRSRGDRRHRRHRRARAGVCRPAKDAEPVAVGAVSDTL